MIDVVKLTNFRNFKSRTLNFSKRVTVISGPNASGKTNILESIFLISTGRSFKAKVEEEMINYDSDVARVSGRLIKPLSTRLEVVLTRGFLDVGNDHPEKVARKKLTLDGVSRRLIDFVGNFKVVLFGPWDMDLVGGPPTLRRKFLDTVLSQVDREYRRSILSYEKGLKQRNRLLLKIREEGYPRNYLMFWNQLLIKNGDYINAARRKFIEFANEEDKLQIPGFKFQIDYDQNVISEGRLEQYKEEEVAAATTLVGPHRDDFIFKIKDMGKDKKERDMASFGSRGEQRMGVLWIKMAELAFIEEVTYEKPTLLLDDIFSELDEIRRKIVIEIAKKQQTIITTAEIGSLPSIGEVEIIEL
jgi:DNA replication and repair protein RecF